MAKIKITDFKIKYSDSFFFDTNIWLLLFGTVADFQKNDQKKYSSLFEEIITKDKSIYITSLIFSEFSNVILRRDFKIWQKNSESYDKEFKKDFVGTEEYKKSIYSITLQLKKILSLPNLIRIGDSFHVLEFDKIFESFESIDFNDSYFAEICRVNDYHMVTNDRDLLLLSNTINIITAL